MSNDKKDSKGKWVAFGGYLYNLDRIGNLKEELKDLVIDLSEKRKRFFSYDLKKLVLISVKAISLLQIRAKVKGVNLEPIWDEIGSESFRIVDKIIKKREPSSDD